MPELFVSTIQKYPNLSFFVFCFLVIFSVSFFTSLIYKKHNCYRLIPCITNVVQILGIVCALVWGSGVIMEHDLQTAKENFEKARKETEDLKLEKVYLICDNIVLGHEKSEIERTKTELQGEKNSLKIEIKNLKNEKNKILKQNKHMKLDWVFNDIYRGIIAYFAAQYKNLLSAFTSGDINSIRQISRIIYSISYKDLCNHAIQQVDFSGFDTKSTATIKKYINKKIENNVIFNEKILKYGIRYNPNYKISNTNECIHFMQSIFKLAQDMTEKNDSPDKIFSFFEKIQDELHQKIDKGLL